MCNKALPLNEWPGFACSAVSLLDRGFGVFSELLEQLLFAPAPAVSIAKFEKGDYIKEGNSDCL